MIAFMPLCPLVLHICGPVAERADIRLYEILREHVADKAALCENLQRFFGRLRQLAAGLARKIGLWQLRLFEVAVKPRINERSVRKVRTQWNRVSVPLLCCCLPFYTQSTSGSSPTKR